MSKSDAAKQEEELSNDPDKLEEADGQGAGQLGDEDLPVDEDAGEGDPEATTPEDDDQDDDQDDGAVDAEDADDPDEPAEDTAVEDAGDDDAEWLDSDSEAEEAALPLGVEDMVESPDDAVPELEAEADPNDGEPATEDAGANDEDVPDDAAAEDASGEDDFEGAEPEDAGPTDEGSAEAPESELDETNETDPEAAGSDESTAMAEEDGEALGGEPSLAPEGDPEGADLDAVPPATEEGVETFADEPEEPVEADLWTTEQGDDSSLSEDNAELFASHPDGLIEGDVEEVSDDGWSAAPIPPIMDAPAGGFSADEAVERFDSLDRACLGFAVARGHPGDWAIDLGSGAGLQGLRLALAGMNALLVDVRDLGDRVDDLREKVPVPSLQVLRKDLRSLEPADLPRPLRLAYCQRTLHFMNYEEAQRLVTMLAVALEPGGRLFLSAAGLESAMGRNYAGRDLPIAERYGLLAPAQARAQDIDEPVCLYATEDLRVLAAEAGLSEVRIWPSEQGNLKGIFEKRE